MANKLAAVHPGEVLREEFLVPMGLSAGALANACGVPSIRIEIRLWQGARNVGRALAEPAE
jgi:plasmid maintenance system antidote protein VapI